MLRANREWACLIASILIGLSCNRMLAQMTTGSMAGTVVDASDAVIPGAEVSLVREGTRETRKTVTAAGGEFLFVAVRIAR